MTRNSEARKRLRGQKAAVGDKSDSDFKASSSADQSDGFDKVHKVYKLDSMRIKIVGYK